MRNLIITLLSICSSAMTVMADVAECFSSVTNTNFPCPQSSPYCYASSSAKDFSSGVNSGCGPSTCQADKIDPNSNSMFENGLYTYCCTTNGCNLMVECTGYPTTTTIATTTAITASTTTPKSSASSKSLQSSLTYYICMFAFVIFRLYV